MNPEQKEKLPKATTKVSPITSVSSFFTCINQTSVQNKHNLHQQYQCLVSTGLTIYLFFSPIFFNINPVVFTEASLYLNDLLFS